MLVFQDLGFRGVAIILISLVFPAFFFVLRRKWRESLARKEEINRLLVIASEEAARAEFEFESVKVRFSSPGSIPAQRVCAVCFTPTSNRCARCKSVHYCSGKCQIIHWRQGHKNECHPSSNSPEIDDEGNCVVGDIAKQFHFDREIPITESNRIRYDYVEIATEKPDFASFAHIPPDLSIDDDERSIHDALLGDELELRAQFHSVSDASQSHASSSSDGTCIDDSISDIESLHDLNADSSDFCSALDLESASSDWNEEQNLPLEEDPPLRVTSSGMFVSGDLKEKASSRTTESLNSNIIPSYKNLSNPSVATTDFWDGSLDYCRSKKSKQSTHAKPDVVEPGNLYSNAHSQGLEASSHTYSGISNTCKRIAEPAAAEKNSREPTRNQSSTIVISKVPVTKAKLINRDRDSMTSGKVGATAEFLKDSALLSSISEKAKANDLKRSSKDDAHTPLLKKVGSSSKAANGLTSGIKEPIAPTINSVKADLNADMPSQVAQLAPSTAVGQKTSVLKVLEQFRPPRLSKQSDDVGRNTEKAVFSYDLFVKLYHWNKVVLRPFGLINCGNSCYANAILQCLAFTPPLTAYLLQGYHSKACAKKEWCFTCEFERLIFKAKEGGSPLSPVGILSQIQKIGSHLSNGKQEDAHEFLRYAIDTMQTICLQDVGVNAFGSLHEETTLMGLTFGGYLRSKIKCTRCRGKSEKQERMMDLTVEISGDIETLEEALQKFTGTEPLDGENKYHCGRCKSYEKAKKKLTILEAPNVLTIALKRFQSGKFGKLNKTIRFPEILNLAPYMRSGSDKSPIYRLYGVVVHLDIMNAAFSGHYVCYVRNSQNKWYKIDDSMVKAVELGSVLSKGAYMLFYSRISPRAPRSIRSSIVCHDLPSKVKTPEVDHSQRLARSNGSSRHRDQSTNVNCAPDFRRNGMSFPPMRNILDIDSSSDNSSLFSHSDEVSSSTTDSNRDSISADDFSDYIFGYNAFFRHSDSDTSSSSSSSSPEYTKHSLLSSSERYSSALLDDNAHSIPIAGDPSRAKAPIGGESGSMDGVSFLHSNSSSKQGKTLVNSSSSSSSSSSREADGEKLGWANPLDNRKSGVHLRRYWTRKAD